MPVKLSRFVRVMSGGRIVTDELVGVRDAKAGAALDELQAQIDRLTAAGLRIPALEDEHRDLSTARADALTQNGNVDKCAALEAVKFDARDAVTDARPKVDTALVTAGGKAAKLIEVDAALLGAQNTVGGIPDAALRAPLGLRAGSLKGRRDELADATEPEAAAAALAKAPALLLDIVKLTADAGKVDAIARARAARLGEVDTALQLLTNAEAAIGGAGFKGPTTASIQGFARRRNTLANAADVTTAAAETAKAPALANEIAAATVTAMQAVQAEADKANKLSEVDTALGLLTTALAGITGAGFKDPATAPVAGLTGRRDLLANAPDVGTVATEIGNAAALIGEIGTAAAAATRAAKAEADRATQLGLVDAAMTDLTRETAAIGEANYKAPIELLTPPVALRRDALAAAADVGAAEAQVALAPTLVIDIRTAETQAKAAQVAANQFTTRKGGIDGWISIDANWINALSTATQPPFTLRLNQLKTKRTALDTTAPTAIAAALVPIEAEMVALYNDAIAIGADQSKATADKWSAAFVGWEKSIGAISATNPVPAETAALRLEQKAAELLADAPARYSALSAFMTKAAALQTKVTDMQNAKKEVEKVGMTITALLSIKPPPTTPPTALAQERLTTLAAIPAAFALGTAAAVVVRLEALKTDMLAIKPKAEDWRAGQLDLDAQKASVAKSLADARIAVDKLVAGDPKTELDAALKALVLRQTAAGTMVNPAAGKALFAIDKEALPLLERAQKALFTAQLAAPDGKQKIDGLIKTLGDKAADPQAEATCRAALAARFNLEVEVLEGLSVDRLPRLYNLFAQVPAAHVGHDKLLKLGYNTDPASDASYYAPGDKKIVLVMGESDGSIPYTAQTGNAVENLNYFSATALHEIGHGVDAKQGIMSDSRMAGAEFGGWQKETIDSVAQAHYAQSFASLVAATGPKEADLRELVKTVLQTGDCQKPASASAKLGSLFAKWLEITSSQGFKNCQAIRNPGVSPWDKPVPAGTRAYHEAYDGSWFSYVFAERAKGISNYQWRAPAEWFAELYAYYHMTKKAVPACVDAYIKG